MITVLMEFADLCRCLARHLIAMRQTRRIMQYVSVKGPQFKGKI